MPTSTAASVCVDASLVIRLLGAGTGPSDIAAQWRRWESARVQLITPTLFYYEVTNVVRRWVTAGILQPDEARSSLDRILGLPIISHGNAALHRRALELAQMLALPAASDAHYLALAERVGAELWTADRRLYRKVERDFSWVHFLEA